jgi:hypothetical protein
MACWVRVDVFRRSLHSCFYATGLGASGLGFHSFAVVFYIVLALGVFILSSFRLLFSCLFACSCIRAGWN